MHKKLICTNCGEINWACGCRNPSFKLLRSALHAWLIEEGVGGRVVIRNALFSAVCNIDAYCKVYSAQILHIEEWRNGNGNICEVCNGINRKDKKYNDMFKVQTGCGEKVVCGVCIEDYAENPKERYENE